MKHLKFSAILANLLFLAGTLSAQEDCLGSTRIYVSPNGSDSAGLGSEASPFQSIQFALDTACVGDTILLFPGQYDENIAITKDQICLAGIGLLFDEYAPESTIIDGLDVATALFASGDSLEIAGITIQNGRANFGAGLYLAGAHNSHVHDVIVRDNTGTGDITAHGIAMSASNCLLENSLITGNYGRKHTVSVGGSNNVIRNCDIIENPTWEYGGGIVSSSQNLLVDNCRIIGNNKGGVAVQYTTCTIVNSTIADNTGFGIRLRTNSQSAEVRMHNCILTNTANLTINQNGISTATFRARNSIVEGLDDYSWVSTYTIFDFDETVLDGPAYIDEEGHLLPVSPGIGSGTTQVEWVDGAISNISVLDLAGNDRPMPEGSLPDMGCYESELGSPLPIAGCMTPEACNYDPFAVEDDGSCNLPGCMNEAACNYDPATTCDGGEAACVMPSCTDEEACNYDADAACSGGECYYGEAGCDDPYACNYVADAVCVDLMLCDYSCCPGPGCCGEGTVWSGGECVISPNCRYDFDLSGDVNLPDLLLFLAHYETTCVVNP